MSAHTKKRTTAAWTEIRLRVPASDADRLRRAIAGLLDVGRNGACLLDESEPEERLYDADEVLPDSTPGRCLRGLRVREDLTQEEMAAKLGISQHHISEMESGARKISVNMAKRIGAAFNVSYRALL